MRKRYCLLFLTVIWFLFSSIGCFRKVYQVESNIVKDGKYDSEFPSLPASGELNKITESVHLLSVMAFYKTYRFDLNSRIKISLIKEKKEIDNDAQEIFFSHKPAVGTATIISNKSGKMVVLTCAHVVNYPDTIINYFIENDGKKTEYIQNISIKTHQNNNIIGIPDGNSFEILAIDEKMDLAILGKLYKSRSMEEVPVLSYKRGKSEELDWGSFVYVIGFPKGQKMISTSIVSNPQWRNKSIFNIDASFNRGSSGGLVLAIRDGIPNFELVGLIKSVSAEINPYLAPVESSESDWKNFEYIYNGDAIVKSNENIFYGVTFVVSIEAINSFIEDNEEIVAQKGFNTNQFFSAEARE